MAEATKEVLMCRKLKKKSVMKTSDKTSMAINCIFSWLSYLWISGGKAVCSIIV